MTRRSSHPVFQADEPSETEQRPGRPHTSVTMTASPDTSAAVWLQPELFRIRDAAAVLGVSPRMVYTFIESGALSTVYLPTTGTKSRPPVRIARADLLAFVERCRGHRG